MNKQLFLFFVMVIGQLHTQPHSQKDIEERMKKITTTQQDSDIVPNALQDMGSFLGQYATEKYLDTKKTSDPYVTLFFLIHKKSQNERDVLVAQMSAAEAHMKVIEPILIETSNPGVELSSVEKAVIYNCATIKQRLNNSQDAGTVEAKDPSFSNIFGRTSYYDGQQYYDNACPCLLYNNLSAEQLEQLKNATKPETKS